MTPHIQSTAPLWNYLHSRFMRNSRHKLDFADHVALTATKAKRALGLLIRTFQSTSPWCKLDQQAALAAYNANVRAIIEYCSVITDIRWCGQMSSSASGERVQHKFLMWLACHTAYDDASLAYSNLLSAYQVSHLEARRTQCDVLFLCTVFSFGAWTSLHRFLVVLDQFGPVNVNQFQ